jgi:hypothetical protein
MKYKYVGDQNETGLIPYQGVLYIDEIYIVHPRRRWCWPRLSPGGQADDNMVCQVDYLDGSFICYMSISEVDSYFIPIRNVNLEVLGI